MVTRNLFCNSCGYAVERTSLGMLEPNHECGYHGCQAKMKVVPSFPVGVKYVPGCGGFHCCDYPKSAEQLSKDYGLERHDSTNDEGDYGQEGYDGS